LNSVLDDNHLLTLPTGERISFGSNVNFIFETHDLKFASPATVSRMGMIYLNNDDVNISSLVSKWKRDNNLTEESKLSAFLD
jgi:dynein heavy chain 2, cytosolic